jgi:hypothetical protein
MPGPSIGPTLKGEIYASAGCIANGLLTFNGPTPDGPFIAQAGPLTVEFTWPATSIRCFLGPYQTAGSVVDGGPDGAVYSSCMVFQGNPPCPPDTGSFCVAIFFPGEPPESCPVCGGGGGGGPGSGGPGGGGGVAGGGSPVLFNSPVKAGGGSQPQGCNQCACGGGGGGPGGCGQPSTGNETPILSAAANCMTLNGPQSPDGAPVLSPGPIRYSTGEIMYQVNDLASSGFGIPWGHTRSFLSRIYVDTDVGQGFDWQVAQWPYLNNWGGGATITLMGQAGKVVWFTQAGTNTYTAKYGVQAGQIPEGQPDVARRSLRRACRRVERICQICHVVRPQKTI